jgi:hypothetical protein
LISLYLLWKPRDITSMAVWLDLLYRRNHETYDFENSAATRLRTT